MSFRSGNTKPVVAKPKPTIEAPQSVADCKVFLKRTDTDVSNKTTSINDIETDIANFTSQIAQMQKQIDTLKTNKNSLQEQLKQHDINKSFLVKCLGQLEKQEKENLYITRCTEFIKTYDWVNPDENHGDSDTPPTKKALPHDLFSYLEYDFQPLDCYTSDEIKKIAHYLKASELFCQLISKDEYNNLSHYTYGGLIEGSGIVGKVTDCSGNVDDGNTDCCCKNRFANHIIKLEYITLDSDSIITHRMILDD
jgi:hypothetical protein